MLKKFQEGEQNKFSLTANYKLPEGYRGRHTCPDYRSTILMGRQKRCREFEMQQRKSTDKPRSAAQLHE